MLYIVPTPIGNLEDITLRGIRILKEVNLIAAEDTRHSRKLLTHFNIQTPITSYYEYNKRKKMPYILETLKTGDVALISDAGTPTISDPGLELVTAVLQSGYQVVPLPGASAITTALSASGLSPKTFAFLGFLPRDHNRIVSSLSQYKTRQETLILFESPNRLLGTLRLMLDVFGSRMVVVAIELTKMFEEFQRGSLEDVISFFEANPAKGEVTILLQGYMEVKEIWTEERVRYEFNKLLANSIKRSTAAKEISKLSGWGRRSIYAILKD
jgi:16S rRNA (cytidine1402-2'-O)-methyltransferase